VRLVEILCALAAAADLGAQLPPETAQRTALIAVALGRALGMPPGALSDLLFGGLLRHIGCSATAHEETALMGDEQELRSTLNGVDAGSPLAIAVAAGRGFARGRSLAGRAVTVARFLAAAPVAVPAIFRARCEVATRLGRRLGLSEGALRALDEAYERFDGTGAPHRRSDQALSPLTAVLAVAEHAAMFLRLPGGEAMAVANLEARSGSAFDPRAVRVLLSAREELLAPARHDALTTAVLDAEPLPHRTVEDPRRMATVLADFADLKSPFTLGHSRRVAALSCAAAGALGLPEGERQAVELAGWLHDLGRVAVSNAIWDKPGRLDAAEWEKVRGHPQQTERVLAAAPSFAGLARLAAAAHERLDAGGYPRGTRPSMAERVLGAADVLAALGEPRPHRGPHEPAGAARILIEEAAAGRLDRRAVNAVLEAAGERSLRAPAAHGLTDREVEVLRLHARGLVDKEIAAALGISHRTVHHHNQSLFAKLGVQTRGAAALLAIEEGLV
jgi:HD-GYP domain-containing protein (c-di-GMP phosphodiesterase class II)